MFKHLLDFALQHWKNISFYQQLPTIATNTKINI